MNKLITTTLVGITLGAFTFTGTAAASHFTVEDYPQIPGAKVVSDYNLPHDGNLHFGQPYSAYTVEQAAADLAAAQETTSDTTDPAPTAKKPTWKQFKKTKKNKRAAKRTCKARITWEAPKGVKKPKSLKKARKACVKRELRASYKKLSNPGASRTSTSLKGVELAQFCYDEIKFRQDYEIARFNKDPRYVTKDGWWTAEGTVADERLKGFDTSTIACPWGDKIFVPFVDLRGNMHKYTQAERESYNTVAENLVVPQGVPNQDGDWIQADATVAAKRTWLTENFPSITAERLTWLSQKRTMLRRSTHPDVVISARITIDVGFPALSASFEYVKEDLASAELGGRPSPVEWFNAIITDQGSLDPKGWYGGNAPDKALFAHLVDENGNPEYNPSEDANFHIY